MNNQKKKELLQTIFEIGLKGVQSYNGNGSLIDHMINTTIENIPNQIIINTDSIKKNIKYCYNKQSLSNVPTPPPIMENTFYIPQSIKKQVVYFYQEKDWLKNIDQEDMEYLKQKGLK